MRGLNRIVSMHAFLRTGILGPITCDLTLADVARTLGAPDRFLAEHAKTIPTYWCYGKLEIEFDEDAPHRMNWFQLEFANELAGDFEILTEDLVLSLEGIVGETAPSAFLQAGLWDPAATVFNIGALADDVTLSLCAGPVEIVFRIDSTFIDDGDAVRYVTETPLHQIVRDIDARTEIDSIYAFPTAKTDGASSLLTRKIANGATWLSAIAPVATEPA